VHDLDASNHYEPDVRIARISSRLHPRPVGSVVRSASVIALSLAWEKSVGQRNGEYGIHLPRRPRINLSQSPGTRM
jgi:hypothetical protein